MNPDETVGAAAKRELEEETGIQSEDLVQLFTFSKPGRDPRTWIITVAHMLVITDTSLAIRAGDDAEDAQWFAITAMKQDACIDLTLVFEDLQLSARLRQATDSEELVILENDGLAFDHAQIITMALQKLGLLD